MKHLSAMNAPLNPMSKLPFENPEPSTNPIRLCDVQVEDPATVWNIRGLNCTAWHRRKVKVAPKKP